MYKRVVEEFEKIPEIVECHFTTGPYTMLVKLYARDNAHLMTLLNDHLQEINGVVSTETLISSTFNTRANEYNFIGSSKLVMFMSNRAGGKGKDDIYVPMPFRAEPDVDLMPEITLTEPKGFNWVLFFFDFDKSDMKPEYFVQLDELVSAMKEFPGVVFEISGHTDERGSDKYNMKLSQERANYVKGLLIERGMSPNELVAVGKGFHETVIKNAQTEPEHEQNRRVDIKILNE
jgi:flagellar motor protein MotB